MNEELLAFGDTNPMVKKIRDMLGVGDYDAVGVVLSQFEREDGKVITYIPITVAEYNVLKIAPNDILKDIGLSKWDEENWLYPAEWYDYIPEGYEIVNICGKTEKFQKDVTDNDRRLGCLPFGLKRQVTKG